MHDCIRLLSDGTTHHHGPPSGLTEFLPPCIKSVSRSVLKATTEDMQLGPTLGFGDSTESGTPNLKKSRSKFQS